MARIFWDAMLFIYFFENHPLYADRVEKAAVRSRERGDQVCTSSLAFGEVLAGWYRRSRGSEAQTVALAIQGLGIQVLPLTEKSAIRFAHIRGTTRLGPADAIHLACAAEADTDLFLTNDKALMGRHIPGIKFIASLESDLL